MGLTTKTQAAIAKAFSGSLSDAVSEVTFTINTGSTYDPNTQSVAHTSTSEVSRGVFARYEAHELRDSAIINTDDKLIVLQNELTLVPEIDMVVTSGSYTATVKNVRKDPANITWELQCRR